MRYEKGHKENTRKRILGAAARRFRLDGAATSGLAAIMADAGLTNGALYLHFDSKEALFREALADALADRHTEFGRDNPPGCGTEAVIRWYLNADHLARSGNGCPSAALLPEICRQPERTRKAYEDGLLGSVYSLAEHLPDPGSEESHRRAMAIFSLMVGTLQIARAVHDASLALEILEDGVQAAMRLAGDDGVPVSR